MYDITINKSSITDPQPPNKAIKARAKRLYIRVRGSDVNLAHTWPAKVLGVKVLSPNILSANAIENKKTWL